MPSLSQEGPEEFLVQKSSSAMPSDFVFQDSAQSLLARQTVAHREVGAGRGGCGTHHTQPQAAALTISL